MSAITRFYLKRIERLGIEELENVPKKFRADVEKHLNK